MVEFFTGLQPLQAGETDPASLIARVQELDRSEAIDRVLVGYSSTWPHNHATAPFALAMTEKFSPIVAHRPGVMAPVAAARYFATLDVLARGRLAINVVVGGSDKDLRREPTTSPRPSATGGRSSTSTSCAAPGPKPSPSTTTASTTRPRR